MVPKKSEQPLNLFEFYKQKEKKIQIQESLIKSLRNATTKYQNAVNTNITAIDIGHKTGLYKGLKTIMGIR